MTPSVETGYRISPRVVLLPGDRFKVAGGPYYRTSDGRRIPLAARGTSRAGGGRRCREWWRGRIG